MVTQAFFRLYHPLKDNSICVITDDDSSRYVHEKLLGSFKYVGNEIPVYVAVDDNNPDLTWRAATKAEIENLRKRYFGESDPLALLRGRNVSCKPLSATISSPRLNKFPLANQVVKVKNTNEDFLIEDWWYNVSNEDWRDSALKGNPAAWNYFLTHQYDFEHRSDVENNKVLYGKIGNLGYLMNVRDLDLPININTDLEYF